MKILVAHPGKQHVFRLAESLYKADMLEGLITTVYNKPGSITYNIMPLIPQKLRNKAMGRKREGIPDDKIILKHEFLGLVCTTLPKIPYFKKYYMQFNDYLNDCFGKTVAKYAIKHNVDAVISFDNNSMAVFEYLQKNAPQIKRILDVSIASRIYLKEVYEKDLKECNEQGLYDEQKVLWNTKYMQRIERELKASEYFLAGSSFVKQSLVYSGVDEESIRVVNYGVDIKTFEQKLYKSHEGLRLIYVGGITHRKGLHHLLKVISELEKDNISLSIAGDVNAEMKIYQKYKKSSNIKFLGFLTHDKLKEEYKRADVFVLSSLGEGMAMVGLEAMSSGLPVVCSTNTGLGDVVRDGVNGFLFETGNDEALKNILLYLLEHSANIETMGRNARETAMNYTWGNYGNKVVAELRNIGEMSK